MELDYEKIKQLIHDAQNLGLYLEEINGEVLICTSMRAAGYDQFEPLPDDPEYGNDPAR